MMKSVSVIFDTGANYSCYYNKGGFVDFEDNIFPRKIKYAAKGLEIFGFDIVYYSVRSENGCVITLRYQAYYLYGLSNNFRIVYPQYIHTSEGYKDNLIYRFRYDNLR